MKETAEEMAAQAMCAMRALPMFEIETGGSEICDVGSDTKDLKRKREKLSFRQHEVVPFPTKPTWGFIHLPNSDPVYSYFGKLIECQNSGHNGRYRTCMTELCDKEVEFVLEYDGPQNPFGPNNRHIKGVDNVIDFNMTAASGAPDAIFSIVGDVKGFVHKVTGEKFISCKLMVDMTIVLKVVATSDSSAVNNRNGASIENKGMGIDLTSDSDSVIGSRDSLDSIPSYTAPSNNEDIPSSRSGDSVDSLSSAFSNFALAPVTAPVKCYHCAQYSAEINTQGKVTRICSLFYVTFEHPAEFLEIAKPRGARKKPAAQTPVAERV